MIRLIFICAITSTLTVINASTCNCKSGCDANQTGPCCQCNAGWYGRYCQKKNVALCGSASQQGMHAGGSAYLAVDGNTDTDFNNGSCAHTDERINSWWSVQLGDNGVNQIKYMRIYHRNDTYQNQDRRRGMEILIDGQGCMLRPDSDIPEYIEEVKCDETLSGHNLTITVPRHYMSLCEVQVFVCSDGWFGKDCDKQCKCSYKNDTCDKITGECKLGCPTDPSGVDCYTNETIVPPICGHDGKGEPMWRHEEVCNASSLDQSQRELKQHKNNGNSANIETVLEEIENITLNKNLTQQDAIKITNILANISQVQDVPPEVVSNVSVVCDKVLEFTTTSRCEEGNQEVESRTLEILDSVTAQMNAGPSGHSHIRTEAVESDVWELKDKQELPIGMSFNDDPNTSFTPLLTPTVEISKTDSSIALTHEFVDSLVKERRGRSIRMSMNLYRKPPSIGTCTGLTLISHIISLTILLDGRPKIDLNGSNVTFILKTKKTKANGKHVCGYWDFSKGSWSTDGCHHTGVKAERDVCVCDHLTNFAVLLDLDGKPEHLKHNVPLTVITMIGLTMSIAGLFITTASHILFRKLMKSNPDKTLFHLALSQLCAWTVFLAGFNQTQSHAGCILVAALLHYFIMASFLWMLAEAVLYFIPLVLGHTARSRTSCYMITTAVLAWGLPLLPVSIMLALDVNLYRGKESYCWMSWTTSLYSFAVPVGLVIVCNMLLYVLIVCKMCWRGEVGQKKAGEARNKMNVWASFVFFILFGLSWVFGYLAVAEAKVFFQYIFCVTASTQGFLIFLLFTARNKKVRESWRNLCCSQAGSDGKGLLKMEQMKGDGKPGTIGVETKETSLPVINDNGQWNSASGRLGLVAKEF